MVTKKGNHILQLLCLTVFFFFLFPDWFRRLGHPREVLWNHPVGRLAVVLQLIIGIALLRALKHCCLHWEKILYDALTWDNIQVMFFFCAMWLDYSCLFRCLQFLHREFSLKFSAISMYSYLIGEFMILLFRLCHVQLSDSTCDSTC